MTTTNQRLKAFLYGLAFIAICFLVMFRLNSCQEQTKQPIVQDTTVYIHDTVTYTIPVKHLVPDTVLQAYPVYQVVDTAAILHDYFAKRFYADTLTDSLVSCVILDTVYQNRLLSRAFTYRLLKPQTVHITTITPVTPEPELRMYLGAGGSMSNSGKPGLSIEGLVTRNKIGIGVGYDLLNKSTSVKFCRAIWPK